MKVVVSAISIAIALPLWLAMSLLLALAVAFWVGTAYVLLSTILHALHLS